MKKNTFIQYNHADYKMKYGLSYDGVKYCSKCNKPTPHIITKWKAPAYQKAQKQTSTLFITPLTTTQATQTPAAIECLFCWKKKRGMRVF